MTNNDVNELNVPMNDDIDDIDFDNTMLGQQKILTVFLTLDKEIHVELITEHFEDVSEEEKIAAIVEILRHASFSILQDSETYANDEERNKIKVPINYGSLYDNLFFEVGVYITPKGQLLVNPSFGRLLDPDEKLHEGLRDISDAILELSNSIEEGSANQTSSEDEESPNSNGIYLPENFSSQDEF